MVKQAISGIRKIDLKFSCAWNSISGKSLSMNVPSKKLNKFLSYQTPNSTVLDHVPDKCSNTYLKADVSLHRTFLGDAYLQGE